MGSVQDPEGAETRALATVADLSGKRVLEVGCGDGRLTWRYARDAGAVLAIDTDEESIAAARAQTPHDLADRVSFAVASALDLDEPPGRWDVALLSWSL
jgi:2-polyprenyl-3-methyl-5-hydroxy-6-metoxy-1,4-benzoquinol methylase